MPVIMRQTIKKLIKEINEVWKEHDTLNNWIGAFWLIRKQIEEVEESNYDSVSVLKESADILIILLRYIANLGISPDKLILWRLNTRHKGKTKEIVKKYAKIFEEEQQK